VRLTPDRAKGPAPLGRALLGRVLVGIALLSSFLLSASAPKADFWTPTGPRSGSTSPTNAAETAAAAALVDGMSDEEVLGQIFMMSYPGDAPPALLFDWIERRSLGGVKIFGWNADDSTKLAAAVGAMQGRALSSRLGIPLLVATDQEGGWIRHVKGATTVTPGNMAIGASGRPYDAYRSALIIGRELAALGVNMNFAPSVDLATKPRSYIIGPRAFSDDPQATAVLGSAFVRGLADAGIIATAKHFPGHGGTEEDSHGVLPVIRVDEKTLWERELVPFRVLAAEGIPAVMSGHLSFPLVSGDALPASLSPFFMTRLLRGRMGFKGLAVTDDLTMDGAAGAAGSVSEACVMAVEAGNDLLMISKLLDAEDPIWQRLLSAYREKPAFRARVRDAATKVVETKLRYLRPRGKKALLPDLAGLDARVPDPEAAVFFQAQAYRSATALRPAGIPFVAKGRLLVAGPFSEFAEDASVEYPSAAKFHFSLRPEGAALRSELEAFDRALAKADEVVLCVANDAGMDFALRAHDAGKRVAIVSVQSPAPLSRAPWAESVVAVYSYSRQSLRMGLAVLSGKEEAQGRLPLRLPK
jgi:beta-N-acetylhexosaminidase